MIWDASKETLTSDSIDRISHKLSDKAIWLEESEVLRARKIAR